MDDTQGRIEYEVTVECPYCTKQHVIPLTSEDDGQTRIWLCEETDLEFVYRPHFTVQVDVYTVRLHRPKRKTSGKQDA